MKKSGGAVAAEGMDFQHRVAAWVSVHILAEKSSTPPWDLPADTVLEWLRCETEQPVDDLLIGTSTGNLIFAQIKRNTQLTTNISSDLALALDQFARQFIDCRSRKSGTQPWDRPLQADKDRLVLITSPISSAHIRVHLYNILSRIRHLLITQDLDEATVNAKERKVFSVVKMHLINSWGKILGTSPSQYDLKELLSLIYVQILDVDGGTNEIHAKNLLRTAILYDYDQDKAAWTKLISLCADLAARQSGADRLDFQHALVNAGFRLKASLSYHKDIERLQKCSSDTFDGLIPLAQIRVGPTKIKIHRACTDDLRKSTEDNSILVVGEPGAGKSGALHDLVEMLRRDDCDYVFLAVDRLGARSLGELRAEIGLDHELPEVLDNWPGAKAGLLVIDALDAARGDTAQKMVQDLIRQVILKNGRWHVVASVRKFDLRYGVEIRELFAGAPPTEFQDPEFIDVRHLNIPSLADGELDQIASQSAELYNLIREAPKELHNLLRNSFNLRLMADLLGTGVIQRELTPIRSQLELLDRYWVHRVIRSDAQGDVRETVLRECCEKMVEERVLHVMRSDIVRAEAALLDLLSADVLTEWQSTPETPPERYILAFSHNVLFDYATARLLLRSTVEKIIKRLIDDPDLVVIIRPSLLFHFRYLWMIDRSRKQFWELVFRIILSDQISEIGKLIGPSVAAELVREMQDMELLYTAIEDPNLEVCPAAEKSLGHLLGALLTAEPGELRIIGFDAGPWCQLLDRVSQRALRLRIVYMIRPLLSTICEHPKEFTTAQRMAAGQTARRLLEFAWTQPTRDKWLTIEALRCVCKTFESDTVASAEIIRRSLTHLDQYGFEEMPWLAREVRRLIDIDPVLSEEIYRAVFLHEESSKESTSLGTSRIIPMTSTRDQDYGMARYTLAEIFPAFLESAPENATRALIAITDNYVRKHHPISGKEHEETFDIHGRRACFLTDYSAIWDDGDTYRHDHPLKMIDAFQLYVEKLAEQPDAVEKCHKIFELLISENRLAVLWRRVLRIAAHSPEMLGKGMLPFALSIPILTGYDTTTPAGEFFKAVFPKLSEEQRKQTEEAILGIPGMVQPDHRGEGEHIRNRLLGCLGDNELVTEEAKRILEQLRANNAVPLNEPPARFQGFYSSPYGEEEYLRDQGVAVEKEANRRMRELEKPVKEFADKYLNSVPTFEEFRGIFEFLQKLYDALLHVEVAGVDVNQATLAWGYLSAACAHIAKIDGFSFENQSGLFIKTVLLEASNHAEPVYHPEYDAQFDDHVSWGSPAPRLEAAQGLIVLAHNPNCAVPEVIEAIKRLSKDPVPAVRYQIARRLNALYQTDYELMWHLIEWMSREEPSRGVLQGLLSGPVQRLVGSDPNRVADVTRAIFDRVTVGSGAKTIKEFCVGILSDLYIWYDNNPSREIILKIAAQPAAYREEAPYLLSRFRYPLTYGPTNPPEPAQDAIRFRARELLDKVLTSAISNFHKVESQNTGIPFDNWPSQEKEECQALVRFIDTIGTEVYFASGAFIRGGLDQSKEEVNWETSIRFYDEARPILDKLADVAFPSVTHQLLEILEFFIQADPRGIFLRIGRVVRAGQQGGYQYESLAADLMVRLVERYLADYRTLLREDTDCRKTLIEVLDAFVQVGWPSARRLTYRLENIFR
jgi:hypothetical protein